MIWATRTTQVILTVCVYFTGNNRHVWSFLTYPALQVQVTTITVHQSYTEAELKCVSSCSPAAPISYVWFKNGQKVMKEETSFYSGHFNPGDNISCALKGHEDYRSPSVCEFTELCHNKMSECIQCNRQLILIWAATRESTFTPHFVSNICVASYYLNYLI